MAIAVLVVLLSLLLVSAAALKQTLTFNDLFHISEGRAGTGSGAEAFFRATYQRQLLVGRSATGLLPSKQLQSIVRTLLWLCEVVYCAGTNKAINKQ